MLSTPPARLAGVDEARAAARAASSSRRSVRRDVVLVHHVGEPVGAEQQAVAGVELDGVHVDVDGRRRCPSARVIIDRSGCTAASSSVSLPSRTSSSTWLWSWSAGASSPSCRRYARESPTWPMSSVPAARQGAGGERGAHADAAPSSVSDFSYTAWLASSIASRSGSPDVDRRARSASSAVALATSPPWWPPMPSATREQAACRRRRGSRPRCPRARGRRRSRPPMTEILTAAPRRRSRRTARGRRVAAGWPCAIGSPLRKVPLRDRGPRRRHVAVTPEERARAPVDTKVSSASTMPQPPPRPTVSSSVERVALAARPAGSRMRSWPGPRPLGRLRRAACDGARAVPAARRRGRRRAHLEHDHPHDPEQEQVEQRQEAELQDGEDGLRALRGLEPHRRRARPRSRRRRASTCSCTAVPLTSVPFIEPRSTTTKPSAVGADLGVPSREARGSARVTVQSADRPIVVVCSPERDPPAVGEDQRSHPAAGAFGDLGHDVVVARLERVVGHEGDGDRADELVALVAGVLRGRPRPARGRAPRRTTRSARSRRGRGTRRCCWARPAGR